MRGAACAERLVDRGLGPAHLRETADLYETVLDAFRRLAAGAPEGVWWVPGRLEVFGKHTDYAGGRTLVAALPRGFAIVASGRAGGTVRVLDAASGEIVTVGGGPRRAVPDREKTGDSRPDPYVHVVVRRLRRNFPEATGGADIAFASNLPRAAGMSSSSALVVGIATALAKVWSLDERPAWRRNIPDAAALATYLASIERGSTFGALDGDEGVGTHGGSEDHAAMLLAKARAVSGFAFVPLRHLADAPVADEWQVVAASSGVAAEKIGAARQAYNRLSEATTVLLRLWNAEQPPASSLGAALASTGSAAARLRDIIGRGHVPGWTADSLVRRLEHFRREDARIPEALRAFRERDRAALRELGDGSQADAEHLLGNQIPETRRLVECARSCGAFAACSFGAGFGGGAWALVERDRAQAFSKGWADEFGLMVRRGPAEVFTATPGPSVLELNDMDT